MTAPIVHFTRLARWGITLARRRALVGIENDPNAPTPVKRLVKLARWATFTGKNGKPNYAGAFRAIGPAAIKLGQSLATRPDLVGEEAANNLLSLQDSLPPVRFGDIKAAIEASFDQPIENLFSEIDPNPVGAASIAQVHKGVTTDGREVAIKVLRPGIKEKFARDIQTYE
ncbi:MAG: AarF/UbiB family protein, partial [Pseudomonadota bacterium]